MDNGRRTGWFEMFGILGGAALAYKFGSDIGGLLSVRPGTYGLLRWLVGAMVTWVAAILIGRFIDARMGPGNEGNTSAVRLWIGGLLWRFGAWAVVLAPVAAGGLLVW